MHRCYPSSMENSLASPARSEDKIKFEKLKLDERSIVLAVTLINTHTLEYTSHTAIQILDLYKVQCACNHVNDGFCISGYSVKYV